MTREEIEEKVIEIVADVMQYNEDQRKHLSANTNFTEDLSADSLAKLDIMMGCEDAFQITISDEDTESIKTIGNAVDYLCENLVK